MAQISTVALPNYTIPKTVQQRQSRTVTFDFSPTQLAANVTQGDNILCMTLRKDARINDCGVRVVGVAGLTGAFVTLRSTENSVSSLLTNPVSVTQSGSCGQVVAQPIVNTAYVKTIELLVGGNSVDCTATGIIEVTIGYDFYKLAG